MTTPEGLAPERTALAWLRSSLALLVAAVALARFAAHASAGLGVVITAVCVPFAVAVSLLAGARYRRTRIHPDATPGDGVLPACVTALVCLLGIAAMGYVLHV